MAEENAKRRACMAETDPALTIKQVSKALKIPPHTIRFWEREMGGLLNPLRTEGGQRRYLDEHIELLQRIGELRRTGLGLGEIRQILASNDKIDPGDVVALDVLAQRISRVVRSEIERFILARGKVEGANAEELINKIPDSIGFE